MASAGPIRIRRLHAIDRLRVGDRVRVLDGPFRVLEGEVDTVDQLSGVFWLRHGIFGERLLIDAAERSWDTVLQSNASSDGRSAV